MSAFPSRRRCFQSPPLSSPPPYERFQLRIAATNTRRQHRSRQRSLHQVAIGQRMQRAAVEARALELGIDGSQQPLPQGGEAPMRGSLRGKRQKPFARPLLSGTEFLDRGTCWRPLRQTASQQPLQPPTSLGIASG
ncbi:MAG: hypothetical protein Q8P67_17185 [archaeon]|nr:hypothetical protein [archaeon]